MIELIGVPFDLCGKLRGSRLGPEAMRLAGLPETLRSLNLEICDSGDMALRTELTAPGGIRNFSPLLDCMKELQSRVKSSLASGSLPLVLGGEHTIAVGGMSAALQSYPDIALLWIDAHADLNVPGTSLSGNLHGMPIAALWGLPSKLSPADVRDSEWRQLLSFIGEPRLKPQRTGWIGMRDVDAGERPLVSDNEGYSITMHNVDRLGIVECVHRFDQWMRSIKAKHLWISFDVDVMDPVLAPGTGTSVRGGLTYRESHLMAELFRELFDSQGCPYELIGLDVVETNPLYDNNNMTAIMAVEWIASLFGKKILGKTQ